jgi:hypothetical protein
VGQTAPETKKYYENTHKRRKEKNWKKWEERGRATSVNALADLPTRLSKRARQRDCHSMRRALQIAHRDRRISDIRKRRTR